MYSAEKANATLRADKVAREEEYINPVTKEKLNEARKELFGIYDNAGHEMEQHGSVSKEIKKHSALKSSKMMDIEQ